MNCPRCKTPDRAALGPGQRRHLPRVRVAAHDPLGGPALPGRAEAGGRRPRGRVAPAPASPAPGPEARRLAPRRHAARRPRRCCSERSPRRPSPARADGLGHRPQAQGRGKGRRPRPRPAPRSTCSCSEVRGAPRDAAPHPGGDRGPAAGRPVPGGGGRGRRRPGSASGDVPASRPSATGRARPSSSSTTTRRRATAAVAELLHADVPVRAFDDGNAALSAIAEEKPDVIVLELGLGGEMGGKDLVNMIKATMEWVDIPIVLWTREAVSNQKEARQIHGADEVVPKSGGAGRARGPRHHRLPPLARAWSPAWSSPPRSPAPRAHPARARGELPGRGVARGRVAPARGGRGGRRRAAGAGQGARRGPGGDAARARRRHRGALRRPHPGQARGRAGRRRHAPPPGRGARTRW